jgi:exosome complex exonuclease DIS3/RRP44
MKESVAAPPARFLEEEMLRSKAFTKITKKGAVVKVVKEHYLRDDIPCGLKGCPLGCNDSIKITSEDDRPGQLVLLLDPFDEDCQLLNLENNYILIPDTNIFLHHMDVIETKSFSNIVVLQTVLEEVRNRSPSIYQRVRALVNRPEKRFFVFSNEHHRDCFAGNKTDDKTATAVESDNDRNDRAIRLATAWYQKHLATIYENRKVTAVLVTNDFGNREKATAEGLKAFDLRGLAEFIPLEAGRLGIQDMLESKNKIEDPKVSNDFEYPEHFSEAALKEGVASGKFLRGTLQVSPFNPFKGTVSTGLEGELATIHLPDRIHLNRAIQGDSVVIEVLKKSDWINESEETGIEENDEQDGIKDKSAVVDDEVTLNEGAALRAVGRVVGILHRKYRAYVGSIDKSAVRPDAPIQNLLFFPMDRKIPRIRIRTRQAANLVGKRILVCIDGWERGDKNPSGHFIKDLGMAGDRATEIAAILLEHDVSTLPFTPAQLAELPREGENWLVQDEHIQGRADFRHLDICSIDPPGCTDIDDALHARQVENGLIEVGVHIADVTFFVQPNGQIDREASVRATTVYLVDRRIDMLPGLLGSNLCSLQGGKERLTFSVIWKMDPKTAEIKECSFARSVIQSRAALTYDMAQERLDKGSSEDQDPVTKSIHLLASLARKLKAKRIEAGALTLASPEVRFNLDTTTANPVDVQVKEMKEANSLVEEFMLLANISVAEKLLEAFPDTALLRRHPTPPIEAFNGLNKALAPYSLALNPGDSKSLADSLDRAVIHGDDFFNRLVRIMTTRCMYQAQYFAAGTLDKPLYWHYGLACPLYTHFTSPIRRYADVLVHRLLAVAINAPGAASVGLAADKTILSDVCDNLNYRNRMAQQAQRSSIDLFTILFFRGKNVKEDAYIIRMMKSSLVVLVPKYGMECVVEINDLDNLLFDTEKIAFVHKENTENVVYRLFQHIKIQISVLEHEASLRERLAVKIANEENGQNIEEIAEDVNMEGSGRTSPKRKLDQVEQ